MRLWKRRPDWLAELQGLLVLVLVAAPLLALAWVGYTAGNKRIGPEVPASHLDGPAGATGGLRPGAEIAGDSWVHVGIEEPTAGQVVGWLLTWLPSFALLMTVLWMLLRLVRESRHSDPFSLATVRRLWVLATVTLAGALLVPLVEALAAARLSESVLARGFAFQYSLPVEALLAGFAFLAVAELVRRGCAMREELETVI